MSVNNELHSAAQNFMRSLNISEDLVVVSKKSSKGSVIYSKMSTKFESLYIKNPNQKNLAERSISRYSDRIAVISVTQISISIEVSQRVANLINLVDDVGNPVAKSLPIQSSNDLMISEKIRRTDGTKETGPALKAAGRVMSEERRLEVEARAEKLAVQFDASRMSVADQPIKTSKSNTDTNKDPQNRKEHSKGTAGSQSHTKTKRANSQKVSEIETKKSAHSRDQILEAQAIANKKRKRKERDEEAIDRVLKHQGQDSEKEMESYQANKYSRLSDSEV